MDGYLGKRPRNFARGKCVRVNPVSGHKPSEILSDLSMTRRIDQRSQDLLYLINDSPILCIRAFKCELLLLDYIK